MDSIFLRFEDYTPIIDKFGSEKLIERYEALKKSCESFIIEHKIEGNVKVDDVTLQYTVLDYFSDIGRLKDYHNIELTNHVKVKAYTAYWFLRRKPLQIIKNDSAREEVTFCNELFVYTEISAFLLQDIQDSKLKVLQEASESSYVHSFLSTLYYYLKFRMYNAQVLELMMLGVMASKQLYQLDENGLS